MKYLSFLAVVFLCGAILFAETTEVPQPFLNLNLLWSGSWEESASTLFSGNLYNRGEIKLLFLPLELSLRTQILERRPLDFNLDPPWGDPEKAITNFTGALYHKTTGSRLLFGIIEEWGLSARIRNPWIRSPPYAENHTPLMADLRTAASSTREDEAYLYLSSPFLEISPELKLRAFFSAQTELENFTPALSGGVDFAFAKNTNLLLETFYTRTRLPPTTAGTWFADPPPLPEREFGLYAAGLLFTNRDFLISADWAFSQTFAWGMGIYGNLGVSITPPLSVGSRARPLTVSLAADFADGRFIYRDGANHGEGFRGAVKVEWKSRYNSLLKISTVLRGPGFGEDFNRSSTSFYYRFPSGRSVNFPLRMTRISLTADRNAVNPLKISDRFSLYAGFSIYGIGVNISGSISGLTAAEGGFSPYPVYEESRVFDTGSASCEFVWQIGAFQFRSKTGCTFYEKKDEKWDFSISASLRFGGGRMGLKASLVDFPEKWSWTVSWRLEIKENH